METAWLPVGRTPTSFRLSCLRTEAVQESLGQLPVSIGRELAASGEHGFELGSQVLTRVHVSHTLPAYFHSRQLNVARLHQFLQPNDGVLRGLSIPRPASDTLAACRLLR